MILSFLDRKSQKSFQKRHKSVADYEPMKTALNELDGWKGFDPPAKIAGKPVRRGKELRTGWYLVDVAGRVTVYFRWSNGDAFDVEITDYH